MSIITRKEWGARPSKGAFSPMRNSVGVAIHYEGVTMGAYTHDKCAGMVRAIQASHQANKKENWLDIAYNLVVCRHGSVYEARGRDVMSGANGSRAANVNKYAVCVMMGPNDDFTNEAKSAVLEAIAYLKGGKVPCGPNYYGHKDLFNTACPGPVIYAWVHAGMPAVGGPKPADPGPVAGVPTARRGSSAPVAGSKPRYHISKRMAWIKPLNIGPGYVGDQVIALDQALIATGFASYQPDRYYGRGTSDAVARFHNKYPQFKDRGKSYDPVIGRAGWAFLRSLASKY